MMRVVLLLAVAVPAWAQQAPEPKKAQERERRPLNLRLDNPSSFATIAPAEKEPQKGLPSLGGDARKVEPRGVATTKSDGGPYPKDTNPNN